MKFFKNTCVPEKISVLKLNACLQTEYNIQFFKHGVLHSKKNAAVYAKIYKGLWIPIYFYLNGNCVRNTHGFYAFTKKEWRRYVKLAAFK